MCTGVGTCTSLRSEELEVHGVAPGRKAEGVTRVIYENSDGLLQELQNYSTLMEING